MSTLKRLLRAVWFFLLLLALQMAAIIFFYPSVNDLTQKKSLIGTYVYDGGAAGIRSKTSLEKITGNESKSVSLHCIVSIFGPQDSCFHRELNLQLVSVDLAHYPNLFGSGETVMRLTKNGNLIIDRNAEELQSLWLWNSIRNALLYAFIGWLLYRVKTTLSKGNKNG